MTHQSSHIIIQSLTKPLIGKVKVWHALVVVGAIATGVLIL